MKKSTLKAGVLLGLSAMSLLSAQAQNDRVHFGVIGGLHSSSASYSDLDKNSFNSPKSISGFGGGVFAEFELGDKRMFSLRPELMFVNRGATIKDIDLDWINIANGNATHDKVDYKINASYADLRLPIICNFGQPGNVRPYIYVAPVLGFATGGKISADGKAHSEEIDVSKANMASTYFAGQLGAGVKIPAGPVEIGIEANYELGLSDTYGGDEKDGKATAHAGLFYSPYNIVGTRKFNGFEVMATLSVPLSTFSGSGKSKQPKTTTVRPQPVRQSTATAIKEKPCYTLDEVVNRVNRGQSVKGLTICAVEQINFENNKSVISRNSYNYLNKLAKFLISSGNKVEISGHTDSRGTMERNMQLSKERAKAVYDYLISKGVSAKRLSYSYYGPKRPRATNDTDAGRRKNRRVEFEIK